MKKRNAVLVGILAMLAVITSIGLTAMLKKPTRMIEKPVQRLPRYRTEYIETDTGEFRTMLPGAKWKPIPGERHAYVIVGEKIILQKKPGQTGYHIRGINVTARKITPEELDKLSTPITVPLGKKTGRMIIKPIKPIKRGPKFFR